MGCAGSKPAVNDYRPVKAAAPSGAKKPVAYAGQPDSDSLRGGKADATPAKAMHAGAMAARSRRSMDQTAWMNPTGTLSSGTGTLDHANTREMAPRARRAAAGQEAVRDQIRKLVGDGGATKQQADVVMESEDEEFEVDYLTSRPAVPKPPEVSAAIQEALAKNLVFKGIPGHLLEKVVGRMFMMSFPADSEILQQGALPKDNDCMYYLHQGQAEVVISGAYDRSATAKQGEEEQRTVQGHMVRILQNPGWAFGDLALLFNSARTASVVAKTDVQVYALDRPTFLQFVMKHASGARTLRFIRRVPLLQGLSDNDLVRVAGRFPERTYEDGAALIRYGERGNDMYLVRYGKVDVLVPTADGGRLKVASLGRGQMIGERAVINDRQVRSADCIAQGRVQVVVMQKRDIAELDNPTIAMMFDYDAMAAVIKKLPAFQRLASDALENVLDRFDKREEVAQGKVIIKEGGKIERVYVIKSGEVALSKGGVNLPLDSSFVREAGGFFFFGDGCLPGSSGVDVLPYTVVAATPGLQLLCLTLRSLEGILSPARPESADAGGGPGGSKTAISRQETFYSKPSVPFSKLELHRIIGTGQFGQVRLVRHKASKEVYALKQMWKASISEAKQIEHVSNERKILEQARHPFCVKLLGAYQDRRSLFLLQEMVPGGELFHHLDLEGAFDEATSQFYAASVLLALEFLHAKGVVYRDLKPENLLLDTEGYVKMADFGFAKYVGEERTFTICGTPDYQAPEVIMRRGTTKAADYWALGVLIFEMLVGDPPFKSLTNDPWDTFRRTLSGRFYVPNFISDDAADLIFKLLQVNPERRLGSGPTGAAEIRSHKWFASLDWKALEARRLPAPLRPEIRDAMDTSNFDMFDDVEAEPPRRPNAPQVEWPGWEWIE